MTFVLRTYVSRQAPRATRCFGRGARWTARPRTRTGGFARPVRSTTPSTCRGSRNGWRRSARINVGPEIGDSNGCGWPFIRGRMGVSTRRMPLESFTTLALPRDLGTPAQGRRLLESALDSLPESVLADAQLLLTEVLSNAILHGSAGAGARPFVLGGAGEGLVPGNAFHPS